MATAKAMKHHARTSRLQEVAAVGVREQAWVVQEAVGNLAKKGKSLLNMVTTKSYSQTPAAGVPIFERTGLVLPPVGSTKTAVINSNDYPVQPLVANLVGHQDHGIDTKSSKSKSGARAVGAVHTGVRQPQEEEYGWETDPNGGWLASFS